LHLVLSAKKVLFETKAVVDTAVDPLQRTAPIVTSLPGRTVARGRDKYSAILLGDIE
jgi:hypothetical protein